MDRAGKSVRRRGKSVRNRRRREKALALESPIETELLTAPRTAFEGRSKPQKPQPATRGLATERGGPWPEPIVMLTLGGFCGRFTPAAV